MKWDCGRSRAEHCRLLENWHRWFAWCPKRVASHDCRWLEYIERKGTFVGGWGDAYWTWEYRAPLMAKTKRRAVTGHS